MVETKTCIGCGKSFDREIKPGRVRAFCSLACCKKTYYHKIREPITERLYTCLECGKQFVYGKSRRKRRFCSKKCGRLFRGHKYLNKKYELVTHRSQKAKLKRRLAVIEYLGGKCTKCGNADWRILQINHIFGNGLKDVRQKPGRNHQLQVEIMQGKRDGEVNLLCANCNILYEFERGMRWKSLGELWPTK